MISYEFNISFVYWCFQDRIEQNTDFKGGSLQVILYCQISSFNFPVLFIHVRVVTVIL